MTNREGQSMSSAQWTRRDLIGPVAMTTTAAAFARRAEAAQAPRSAASDKVRALLETIVRDTPEIGLQVVA